MTFGVGNSFAFFYFVYLLVLDETALCEDLLCQAMLTFIE